MLSWETWLTQQDQRYLAGDEQEGRDRAVPTYVGIGLSCCHHSGIPHHWKLAPRTLFSGQVAHLHPCGPPSSSSCAISRQGHTPHLVSDTPHLRDQQAYLHWCSLGTELSYGLYYGSDNPEALDLRGSCLIFSLLSLTSRKALLGLPLVSSGTKEA